MDGLARVAGWHGKNDFEGRTKIIGGGRDGCDTREAYLGPLGDKLVLGVDKGLY